MRKRWKLICILLGCGIVAVLILTLWRESEPRYKGRSLSEWVMLLPETDSQEEADRAIHNIGSNAVPFLLKWFPYDQPAWRKHLESFSHYLPPRIGDRVERWARGRGSDRETGAIVALYRLGPEAKAAVPTLSRLIDTEPVLAPTYVAMLAHMGGEGLGPIFSALTNHTSPCHLFALAALVDPDTKYTFDQAIESALLDCLAETNRDAAVLAAQALCYHQSHQDLVLQTFLQALLSDDKDLRYRATMRVNRCLMHSFSVSSLLQFLADPDSPLSAYAAGALGDMHELPETVVPALTKALRDHRPLVRSYAASAVGSFAQKAEPAVLALLDAFSDPDDKVRLNATNAFFKVPAYAVLDQINDISKMLGPLSEGERIKFFEQIFSYDPRPPLARLMSHSDHRVREMATNALRMLKSSNIVEQTPENASGKP